MLSRFWSDFFWLPSNTTWEDISNGPRKGRVYAEPKDFWALIYLVIINLSLRFLSEKYVFVPLGRYLKVSGVRVQKAPPNGRLEAQYQKSSECKNAYYIAKQLDLSERLVERWWRLRRSQDKPTTLVKFCESMWRGCYYLFNVSFGIYAVWDKDWVGDVEKCFEGIPHQGITPEIWWLYMLTSAFYISLIITQFRDVHRKDFWQMFIHHIATVILLFFSWVSQAFRIGSLVIILHDVAEVFLDFGKSANYAKSQRTVNYLFAAFVGVWILSRLVVYPFYVLPIVGKYCSLTVAGIFIYILLMILFVLTIFWTWLIFKMAKRTICLGRSWYVCSVMLSMLGIGMGLGLSSCLLLELEAPESTITSSLETVSWFVASLGIASMFGYLITAFLMDSLGRRTAYGLVLLPYMVGMVLTFTASDITTLICGRILTGITAGATTTLGPIVIGEYCSPQYRGMFLNMKTALVYLGSLIVHILGYHMHWRRVVMLCCVPHTLALIITYTWPESPSWLAQRKRYCESEEAFYHLRGTTEDAVQEIKEIIRVQKSTSTRKRTFALKIVEFLRKFTKKNFLKPVLVFVFGAVLIESSGRHIFPSFAAQITSKLTGDGNQTFYYTLAVDILITVSVLFSSYLIKVFKLRKLLFSTGLVSCTALALSCLFLYLTAIDVLPNNYSAIPLSLFGLYFLFANLACAPVPLALLGEIFPLEHRAAGPSVAGFIFASFMTTALKIMPLMLHTMDVYGAFAVLALCMALSLFALYFILPETKDKTLQEIEEFFDHGRFKRGVVSDEEEHLANDNLQMIYRREESHMYTIATLPLEEY